MEAIKGNMDTPAWFVPYEDIRADSYVMLASLLSRVPSHELLHILRNLAWEDGVPVKLDDSLKALRRAGHDAPRDALEAEFNRLFVGLGGGELVPYASWYRERKIQALPLASLRADLLLLGLVRQAECREPEDHAGALCEIMALISGGQNGLGRASQAEFFRKHLAGWMMTFFRDLQSAAKEDFYGAVGKFGESFLTSEDEYLQHAGG